MAHMGKYTMVYCDIKNGVLIHYVRLCPIETAQFRHGISLSTPFCTEEGAKDFADLVDQYVDQFIEAIRKKESK